MREPDGVGNSLGVTPPSCKEERMSQELGNKYADRGKDGRRFQDWLGGQQHQKTLFPSEAF